MLTVALRALRAVELGLARRARRATASAPRSPRSSRPATPSALERAAAGARRASSPHRCRASTSRSPTAARSQDPVDLYRAGKEALLAANVAEAEGIELLAFEDTGSYRLLLPAMSEDPGELERFYEETVAPLVAYDEQYETELVATIEAYLDNDGNVTPTAEQLFTHRHTIRYRLERVQRALRPRHHLDRGPREARPRAQGDARARHRPARAGPAMEPGTEAGRAR